MKVKNIINPIVNEFYSFEKVSQVVRQLEELPIFNIPWSHNVLLITKIKNLEERLWYAQKVIENGWGRNMLEMWIESDLYHRQGKGAQEVMQVLLRF